MISKNGIPDDELYVIKVYEDGTNGKAGYFEYNNALDAVNAFNKFVDLGDAKETRSVYLIEPNERIHTRMFMRGEKGVLTAMS
jgi:hypothetical protein